MENNYFNFGGYEYSHIYNLLHDIFKFKKEKYGDYLKDTLKILLEFEKNGETFIDVDTRLIFIDLLKEGWPDQHLKTLNNLGLLNSYDSPFIFKDRKLSLSKWSLKIDRVIESFLERIDSKISINLKEDNKLNQIKNIFQSSNIVFLQGGPGTGKTTLIINFILNCLDSDHSLNIGIAAPTGKAVSRLKESLNKQKEISLKKNADRIDCQTLHRWIFNSHNKSINLKFKLKEIDIFIIDEMSMINIDMIDLILSLLAKDCNIFLVGDKNQLTPVNNCSIWNYLFEYSNNSLIKACTINLSKIYRNSGDIEFLSKCIFNKNNLLFQETIERISIQKKSKEVNILRSNNKNIPINLLNIIKEHLKKLQISTSNLSKKEYIFKNAIGDLINNEGDLLNQIFKDLQSHLILCQKNSGTWSVENINEILIGQKKPYDFITLEEGIPIMCTENNNELGISNGDIGVLIGKNQNRKFLFRKYNNNNEQVVDLIEPSTLESVVPAIAITIHKSQGSESEKVSILWNQKSQFNRYKKDIKDNSEYNFFRDNYEKRLLYTAITRAKKFLDIYYLN